MGTFGHTAFENDAALVCIDELIAAEKPAIFIKSVVTRINQSDYLDAEDCCRLIAIAETLASIRGYPPRHVPEELKEWVVDTTYQPANPLATSVQKACKLVLEESELRELWRNDRGWRNSVNRTIERLDRSPVPGKPNKKLASAESQGKVSAGGENANERLSPKQLGKQIRKLGGYYSESSGKPYSASVSDEKNSDALLQTIGQLHGLQCLNLDYGKLNGLDTSPLGQLTSLVELEVQDARITADQLQFAQELKKLQRIQLQSSGPRADVRLGDDALEHIADCRACTELNLSNCNISDEGLKHLANLKQLQELDLSSTGVSGTGVKWLNASKLRKLLLFDCKLSVKGIKAVGNLGSLRRLDLRGADLAGVSLSPLAGLAKMESLNLQGTGVSNRGVANLLAKRTWPALQKLDLGNSVLSDEIMEPLGQHSRLKDLILANTKVNGNGMGHLGRLKKLERLDLAGSPVTDEGLAELTCPKLKWLSLAGSNVTNRCIPHLAKLKKLSCLFLDETQVDDEMMEQLAGIKTLRHLGLAQTSVTAKGMECLYGHPNLYMVSVSLGVYSSALEKKLRKKCPEFFGLS